MNSNCYSFFHYGALAVARDENGDIIKKMAESPSTLTECKIDGSCSEVSVTMQTSGPGLFTDSEGNILGVVLFACTGEGDCSVTINGTFGTKIKWNSDCFERLQDAHLKTYTELIRNPDLTTTIDGTDKTINIDCISESDVVSKMINDGWYSLRLFFANLLYSGKVGFRGGFVLCQDGNEFSNVNPISCRTRENVQNDLSVLCENHCDIDNSECGTFASYMEQACNLDNPSQDLTIYNR